MAKHDTGERQKKKMLVSQRRMTEVDAFDSRNSAEGGGNQQQ